MSKLRKVIFFIIAFILISIAIGSIVFGIILLKKSVWIGIGVYLAGQIIAGMPLVMLTAIGKKKMDNDVNQNSPITNLHEMNLCEELIKVAEEAAEKSGEANEGREDSALTDVVGDWWDNPPADTSEFHYEVSYANGTTLQISRDWAKTNVNIALAQYVSNTIDSLFLLAGETYSSNSNFGIIRIFREALTEVQYRFRETENQGVYILAALPLNLIAEKIKAAAEANRKMQASIDKYFN